MAAAVIESKLVTTKVAPVRLIMEDNDSSYQSFDSGACIALELPGILVEERISCSNEVVAEEASDALKLTV